MRHVEVLGFTGTIASGKTARCKRLLHLAERYAATQAVYVHRIDADLIGHSIYQPGKPCYHKLVGLFGPDILLSSPESQRRRLEGDGSGNATAVLATSGGRPIDRRALGRIVFGNRKKLELLNATCWPYITAEIRATLRDRQDEARNAEKPVLFVLLEAAMLAQSIDLLRLCTSVWITHCSPKVAVERVMRRDRVTREEAAQRVGCQPSFQSQMAQLARQGFASSVRCFDTSDMPLDAGLRLAEDTFEVFWRANIAPHLT